MDKATAEKLVIDQWRALPANQRRTLDQALAFSETVAASLSFETLGNPASIVRAWVVREFQGGAEIRKAILGLRAGPASLNPKRSAWPSPRQVGQGMVVETLPVPSQPKHMV